MKNAGKRNFGQASLWYKRGEIECLTNNNDIYSYTNWAIQNK